LRQEQPPTENEYSAEYNAFLPAQAPDSTPTIPAPATPAIPPVSPVAPQGIAASVPPAAPVSAASSTGASQQSAPSRESRQVWALRAIAAALPGCQTLRILRFAPASGGQQAQWQQVAALQREQSGWSALATPPEQPFMQALEGGLSASVPTDVTHLPGRVLLPCRDEQGTLRGALLIEPDILTGGAQPDAALLPLLQAQAWLILELAAAGQEQQRLAEMAASESSARDAFISFAAHELRSPLTSIKGYAQLLVRQARKNPLPDAMLRSVQSIEQQSVRMSEMLGEMLDASRILRGRLEMIPSTVDLSALVKKVVERRRSYFPEHDLIVLGAETPLIGRWDGTRVEQIVRDLLDNAARHSPNDTAVVIELMRSPTQVTVSVRDQGTGIAEREHSRIFEYLYRTQDAERRNLSGLGLGLFVSRHLAERLGGHLWLHASSVTPPTGSEFRFTLPLTTDVSPEKRNADANGTRPASHPDAPHPPKNAAGDTAH